MRRRLTVAILVTVAAALVLAGLGTIVLARFGTARATQEGLRSEVETAAALVKLGQARVGELDARQLAGLEAVVCAGRSGATERVRLLLCQPEGAPLDAAVAQLCTAKGYLHQLTVPSAMGASRSALCADRNPEALAAVSRAWCGPLVPELTAGRTADAARLLTFAIRAFCEAIGSPQPQASSGFALTDEPVDLVTLDGQGHITSGTLPEGVSLADLQVDELRAGATVTGLVGRGSFAAAPVDPLAVDLQVVVAARPNNSSTIALVPWFLLASGATLLLGLVVAARVSRSLVEPLQQATAVTAQIAAGDLDARLPSAADDGADAAGRGSGDEVAQLSRSINAMAEALTSSRAAERQFILSVSHDLRTPLTSIRGYAEAIADGATDPDRAAQVILSESRRLERLVADLLQLGMLDAHQFTFHAVEVDLDDVASESVDAVRPDVEQAGLTLDFRPWAEPVPVRIDPDRFGQVVANIVENAIKYAATGIVIAVERDDQRARIEITDDGPGIPDADLPHVFERLYVAGTAPPRRQVGTGLGLSIAAEIVQAMGGTIAIANDPAGGARVTIELAVMDPAG